MRLIPANVAVLCFSDWSGLLFSLDGQGYDGCIAMVSEQWNAKKKANLTLGSFSLSEGQSHTGRRARPAVSKGCFIGGSLTKACNSAVDFSLSCSWRSQWSCSGLSPSGLSLGGSECLVKTHVNDHRQSQLCPLMHTVT